MARRRQHLLGRALLDDPPQVHDRHAVGDVPRQPEVVGDDEDRDVGLAHQAQHQREDLAAHRGVEARDRLVGHEQARLEHHRPGDDHALALAAGDLVGVAGEEALGRAQAGARQRLRDELLLVAGHALDAHALGHRLVDRLAGVERAGRVLEDHLHLAAVRAQRAPVVAQRLPAQRHRPRGRALEPDDRARERRLAAARLAHEGDDLAGAHREVDAVDRAGDRAARRANSTCRPLTSSRLAGRHPRARHVHAGRAAPRPGRPQLEVDGRARLDRVRAARVERAARGQLARIGRVARQAGRRHPEGGVADDREGGRQRARVRMRGRREDLVARPLLDDPPRVHDRDPPAHRGERREVVGDEDDGQPEALLEVLEQPQHLRLDHDVERGRRLVGDQQPRLAREREADEHALALAAGELVRVVARAARRQPDELEQLADARRHLAAARAGRVQPDRLADLAPDALDGVERVQRALEDDRELGPAHGAQAPGPHRQHVLAVEQDRAGDLRAARQQPQQRAGQRRLAAARLAGQAERLADAEVEVDAAHGGDGARARAVGDVQVADREQRRRARGRATALMRAGPAAADRGPLRAPARTA